MLRYVFLCLFALPALADTVYVTEFKAAPPVTVYYQAVRAPALANQTVAVGAVTAQSAAFNAATGIVRIHVDVACHINIGGTNPTATTSSMLMSADSTEYFVVTAGDKLAVIEAGP